MEQWLYCNNQITKYDTADEGLFVWQRMRSCGHTIPHISEHITTLKRLSEQLFGITISLTAKEVEESCTRLLLRGNYSDRAAHIIEIRVDSRGEYSLRVIETSIYKRLDLRVIRPKGHIIHFAGEGLELPTSTALSVGRLLQTIVARHDCSIAVTTDSSGIVTSVDLASPIIVKGNKITLSPTIQTPEFRQLTAVIQARYPQHLTIAPISTDALLQADELFYIDSRGITSVAQAGESFYADSFAYALSKAMK